MCVRCLDLSLHRELAMDATVLSTHDAVIAEIDIAAPPERVFQALTRPEDLKRWFTNESCPVKFWKMDARPGGRYSYETQPSETVEVNGINEFKCEGEILEFDPPRLLVYTWVSNWHLDQSLKTTVRWELTAKGKGTHVKVVHENLASEDTARKDYAGGWPGVLNSLRKFSERS